jgi:hypothetical protein
LSLLYINYINFETLGGGIKVKQKEERDLENALARGEKPELEIRMPKSKRVIEDDRYPFANGNDRSVFS